MKEAQYIDYSNPTDPRAGSRRLWQQGSPKGDSRNTGFAILEKKIDDQANQITNLTILVYSLLQICSEKTSPAPVPDIIAPKPRLPIQPPAPDMEDDKVHTYSLERRVSERTVVDGVKQNWSFCQKGSMTLTSRSPSPSSH